MHWFLDPIINHYADFKGRATRQQFWMYTLFSMIGYYALFLAGFGNLVYLFTLGLLLPTLAIAVRRFHDIGKSWKLLFLLYLATNVPALVFYALVFSFGGIPVPDIVFMLLPLVYVLFLGILVFLLAKPSQLQVNKYGPPFAEVTNSPNKVNEP